MIGKQMKSAPCRASIRADSQTVVSMQIRQPMRPIDVSNTGKDVAGRQRRERPSLVARCTLRYTPSTLPSGPTRTALL